MRDDIAIATGSNVTAPAAAAQLPRWARQALPPLAVLVALLLVWEGSKLLFGINDQKLPHVADVLGFFLTRTQNGRGPLQLWSLGMNALATFGVALGGFVLGGLLGFGLALLFANSRLLERGMLPFVIGSQTVPILAIAPMVVVGLGRLGAPSDVAKIVVAAYLTFFPVTIGVLRGLRSVPADALALMRSYAASGSQVFWKLKLPASLPYLFTALKVAATASVIGAIVAELPAGSRRGIGVVLLNAATYYNSRPPALWAAVIVAGLVGLAFYGLVVLAERLVVKGQRSSD
jgi:NitT/TauT family transport system permease protein